MIQTGSRRSFLSWRRLLVGGTVLIVGVGILAVVFVSSGQPESVTPPATLNAVVCPTSSECIAARGSGELLISEDGARSWFDQMVPTEHYLFGVACMSETRCVAVGDAGTVLISSGLNHWRQVRSGTGVPLLSVTCAGPDSCVASGDGGTLVATHDGGSEWQTERVLDQQTLKSVACLSVNRCVAVSDNATKIAYTPTELHWSKAAVRTGSLNALFPLNGVSCQSGTCVSVGGHGLVASSQDSGATWSFPFPALPTSAVLNAVSCQTVLQCVAVGTGGTIVVTRDGGTSWTKLRSPTDATLLGVSCQASGPCVVVGDGMTIVSTGAKANRWILRQGIGNQTPTPVPVMVVGDSFASTLATYVGRVSSAYGVTLVDKGTDGCGLARGNALAGPGHKEANAVLQIRGGPCRSAGSGWPQLYQADIEALRPQVALLVIGPWDLSTRLIDGRWSSPGQANYDTYYRAQLTKAVKILTSKGGRVAIATPPYVRTVGPEACAPAGSPSVEGCPTLSDRVMALDATARVIAARYPGRVRVIDLGQRLSPNDHFTSTVDGVVVRAADGVHLSEAGGEWLAPWLDPLLVSVAHH